MAQNFNSAAVTALFQAVQSTAAGLGDFKAALTSEPRAKPGTQMIVAFWLASIRGIPSSGLSATSGLVVISGRVYKTYLTGGQKELDALDPAILTATCDLMAAFSNDFTVGGTVREIDLLGQFGTPLSAQAAYVEQENQPFRVMDLTIPFVIDDLWTQEAG
jgi:hypothetical protein